MHVNQQNIIRGKKNQWSMTLEKRHFRLLFRTFYHLGVMLGSLLCDFEGPLGSIRNRFEHSKMGLVLLRVYVNDFRIIFDDFQKIHIFPKDFNDFIEFWGQLESTSGSLCGFKGIINSKMGLESAIRSSIGSKMKPEAAPSAI